jgi:hypothetical protein
VWWRRTCIWRAFGISSALATASLFGALRQIVAGGTAWPGMVAGGVGLAVGIVGDPGRDARRLP